MPRPPLRLTSLLALAALACGGSASRPASGSRAAALDGAPTPREAVLVFLTATGVRSERTLGAVWGSERGPARATYDARTLREYAASLACVFANDSAHILEEHDTSGAHAVRVELFRPTGSVRTTLLTVRGPGDRWYVSRAEDAPTAGSCR